MSSGFTALALACGRGHLQVVKLLLQLDDIDVNLGSPALAAACLNGYLQVVSLLLADTRIKVNGRAHGATSLHYAARNNEVEIMRLLLNHKDADVNVLDDEGLSPLLAAALVDSMEAAELLLQWPGIDSQLVGRIGWGVIHFTARTGNIQLMKMVFNESLLNAKADGYTPLAIASHFGHQDIVEFLLAQKNIKVDERVNDYGHTALYNAVAFDHSAIVRIFVEDGRANVTARFCHRELRYCYPIIALNTISEPVLAELLRSKDIDVNAADDRSATALHNMAGDGKVIGMRLLLQRSDIRVNVIHHYGYSPLGSAIRRAPYPEVLQVVSMLLNSTGSSSHSKLLVWEYIHIITLSNCPLHRH